VASLEGAGPPDAVALPDRALVAEGAHRLEVVLAENLAVKAARRATRATLEEVEVVALPERVQPERAEPAGAA
jgi:hypothetical protein